MLLILTGCGGGASKSSDAITAPAPIVSPTPTPSPSPTPSASPTPTPTPTPSPSPTNYVFYCNQVNQTLPCGGGNLGASMAMADLDNTFGAAITSFTIQAQVKNGHSGYCMFANAGATHFPKLCFSNINASDDTLPSDPLLY